MNAFIISFCCLAVAFTSGSVIPHTPSGSVGISVEGALVTGPSGSVQTNNGLHGHGASVQLSGPSGDLNTQSGHILISGPGYLDNTWGHAEDEHAGDWHNEDDGQWKAEEHKDWANDESIEEEKEKAWEAEEEKKWDENVGQLTEDHNDWNQEWHRVKRQAPRKISNGPEGRWNKELERYEYTTEGGRGQVYNDNNQLSNGNFGSASFDYPAWYNLFR